MSAIVASSAGFDALNLTDASAHICSALASVTPRTSFACCLYNLPNRPNATSFSADERFFAPRTPNATNVAAVKSASSSLPPASFVPTYPKAASVGILAKGLDIAPPTPPSTAPNPVAPRICLAASRAVTVSPLTAFTVKSAAVFVANVTPVPAPCERALIVRVPIFSEIFSRAPKVLVVTLFPADLYGPRIRLEMNPTVSAPFTPIGVSKSSASGEGLPPTNPVINEDAIAAPNGSASPIFFHSSIAPLVPNSDTKDSYFCCTPALAISSGVACVGSKVPCENEGSILGTIGGNSCSLNRVTSAVVNCSCGGSAPIVSAVKSEIG